MIAIKDVVLEKFEDGDMKFLEGHIKSPVTLFGRKRFADEEDEKLGLVFEDGVEVEEGLRLVNEYLKHLARYKEKLIEAFNETFSEVDITKDWYETLEVFGGSISVSKDGTVASEFTCGDNVSERLLTIILDGEEVEEIYYEPI